MTATAAPARPCRAPAPANRPPAPANRTLAPANRTPAPANTTPAPANRSPVPSTRSPVPASRVPTSSSNFRNGAPPAKRNEKPESDILFQTYFKSVGPRTYAAQVKRAGNGNHFVVLTEGKRDDKTGEIRKTRLFVFSEDFTSFFKMLHEAAVFIRENPVPEEVKKKREKFWARNGDNSKSDPPKNATPSAASHSARQR
jgi:hypothetical protein